MRWTTYFVTPGLLALLPLAVLVYWLLRQSGGRVWFSSLRLLPHHARTWRTRLAPMPDVLQALAVVAVVIAAAGPIAGDERTRIRRDGIAMVFAVDVSTSMMALDLAPPGKEQTRLDTVKQVFEKFVLGAEKLRGRRDDAIGLISFARYADTRSPITLDHANLVTALRALQFADQESGEDGTALGAGLSLAVERIRNYAAKSRVVVLLTDGVQTESRISLNAAIASAQDAQVKVYTIGAGTNGYAPVRVPLEDGGSRLMQMPVEIDEAALNEVASKTGGAYFRATDANSLAAIYQQIDALERSRNEDTVFASYTHYYSYFVVLALALVGVALVLRTTVLRRLP